MNKTIASIFIAFFLVFGMEALAEEWKCPQCGYSAAGNFCSNCGAKNSDAVGNSHERGHSLIGRRIVIEDICEFVIQQASFISRLEPENPAMFYSYYQADDGKMYFCIKVSYTNLTSNTVSMQNLGWQNALLTGELTYAGRYKYNGFLCYEQNLAGLGGSMTHALTGSIDPLCTEVLYYLIEVPSVVCESNESIHVKLIINANEYEIAVR